MSQAAASTAVAPLPARPRKIWMDGRLVDPADATVSVYDHGLLYGDGVFEGLRCYRGRIFKMESHLRRLEESAARIRLSIHYYLVAVLFILFDVESIFLIPWAATAKEFHALGLGGIVFAEITLFVLILGVGLAFVWRKGGLDWDR